MHQIFSNSKRLSELQQISSVFDDDEIVVERQVETESGLSSQSFRVGMSEFKRYVFDRLTEKLGLGSAAFLREDGLSLFAHGHPYTDIEFFPSFGPQSDNKVYETLESCDVIGKLDITKYNFGHISNTEQISVSISKFDETINDTASHYRRFEPGQVEMLGVKNLRSYLTGVMKQTLKDYGNFKTNVDIMSQDFNGFVVPNGTTFTCAQNEFREACRLFAGDPNATSFTVPNLNGFFRANNNTDATLDSRENKTVPKFNALTQHSHAVSNTSSSQQTNISIPELLMQADSNGNIKTHNVKPSICTCKLPIYIKKLNLNITGVENPQYVNIVADKLDAESYPRYIEIPALIYIGNRYEQETVS